MMNYLETEFFLRDLKKLLKKFSTLKSDLKSAKKAAIELYHIHKIDNQSVFELQGFSNKKI